MKHFPDMRRVLNELQRYAAGGIIDAGILAQIGEVNLSELMLATPSLQAIPLSFISNNTSSEIGGFSVNIQS